MTYLAVITNSKKVAPGDRKRLRAAIEDAPFAKVEWFPIRKGSAAKDAAAKAVNDGADIVLACEIIEHLTRAPHVMMLNINSWLKPGGRVVLTTPNGAQFDNPLRVKPKMPDTGDGLASMIR